MPTTSKPFSSEETDPHPGSESATRSESVCPDGKFSHMISIPIRKHSTTLESPSGEVERATDAKSSPSPELLPVPTSLDIPRLREAEKAEIPHRALPSELTVETLSPLTSNVSERSRENLTVYVSQLTPLELAIVRHAAVAVLSHSLLRDKMDLDHILEMVEPKGQRFASGGDLLKTDLRKKAVLLEGPFGLPLELLVERDGIDSLLGASKFALRVPCFIDKVISAMRQMDLSFEGNTWQSASYNRPNELIAILDRDPNSVNFSRERPEDIAYLLEQFFCGLPDPLLTVKLQELFITAAGLPNEERKRLLHMLMLILPKCHRDTLEVLFIFLKWVASPVNDDSEGRRRPGIQLNLSDLAHRIANRVLYRGGELEEMEYGKGVRIVTEMLKNQDTFFTVPEEFLPLLQDQGFFVSGMELSGKDFMKLCEMYIGIKFDEPDTRMKGTTAKRVQCVMGSGGQIGMSFGR